MALTQTEQKIIQRGMTVAKQIVEGIRPILGELNAIYDSQGGLKTTITQDGIDANPQFAGLTKQQLDDGMFALTATIRGDIENAITQLEQLAVRA